MSKKRRQPAFSKSSASRSGVVSPSGMSKRKKKELLNNGVCFKCRKPGHSMKSCSRYQPTICNQVVPSSSSSSSSSSLPSSSGIPDKILCFRCGLSTHTLATCVLPPTFDPESNQEAFPFATCFICNSVGHISRACPKNSNGLYPKGGACRFCGSKFHFLKDCPDRRKASSSSSSSSSTRHFVPMVTEVMKPFSSADSMDCDVLIPEKAPPPPTAPTRTKKKQVVFK